MAKKEDEQQEEELANWDPEAPIELTEEDIARQRHKRWASWGILAVLAILMVASILYALNRSEKPDLTITNSQATGMVSLDGEAVSIALAVSPAGKLEGPCVMMEATGPCTARLGVLNHPAEEFRLIGLSDSDGMTEKEVAALNEAQRKNREERLASLNALRREAIHAACGANRLWMIRFPKAAPDQPASIFLFKPQADIIGIGTPSGQATLINAMLLRDGKASLLTSQQQPLLDPMTECQLAALIHARHEGVDNSNTVWDPRFGLKFPLTKQMQAGLENLKPYVQ